MSSMGELWKNFNWGERFQKSAEMGHVHADRPAVLSKVYFNNERLTFSHLPLLPSGFLTFISIHLPQKYN